MTPLERFKNRFHQEWFVPFCRARNYSTDGFVGDSLNKLSSADADDFMYALDRGLVEHREGCFLTSLSKSKEQIFWEGSKKIQPRKISLWLEPIITIAGMARLHRDFAWPVDRIGLQSADWAFDLVAYGEENTELLVCEVKKSVAELDKLTNYLLSHAHAGLADESSLKSAELNAYRKVSALRRSNASVVWLLGPNRYQRVFHVLRNDASVKLVETSDQSLLSVL